MWFSKKTNDIVIKEAAAVEVIIEVNRLKKVIMEKTILIWVIYMKVM